MTAKELKFLLLIIVIFIAACIETDIYLPAFPDMMLFFLTTEEQIQSLLTWNFFGICISGPFYGPISDSFGRKKPLLIALGFFLIGSIVTLFAQSFDVMLFGRLLQGIGSGGCFTLGTAVIFDGFSPKNAIKALNHINMIVPFIMAVAPLLGGFLNHMWGFRSNFIAIAICVAASLLLCLFFLPETLQEDKKRPLEMRRVASDFKRTLTSLPFWLVTLFVSIIFGGYLAFLSISSVLFVMELGVDKAHFPFFQAFILIAWLIGSLTFNSVIAVLGTAKTKIWGIALVIVGGLGFAIGAYLFPTNPYLATILMGLYALGANWSMGLYFPEGMQVLPDIKGVTASVLTSMRLLIGAWLVGLTAALYDGTIYPLAGVLGGSVLLIIPIIYVYERYCPLALEPDVEAVSLSH